MRVILWQCCNSHSSRRRFGNSSVSSVDVLRMQRHLAHGAPIQSLQDSVSGAEGHAKPAVVRFGHRKWHSWPISRLAHSVGEAGTRANRNKSPPKPDRTATRISVGRRKPAVRASLGPLAAHWRREGLLKRPSAHNHRATWCKGERHRESQITKVLFEKPRSGFVTSKCCPYLTVLNLRLPRLLPGG
jgi:hypothetical protein